MEKHIAVIGGGVSGLTSGLTLLDAGFAVTIFARELPPHTTSDVAAAFWYPDGAEPVARVRRWAAVSHKEFLKLTAVPESGISLKAIVDLAPSPFNPPDWLEMVEKWEKVNHPPNLHGYRTIIPAIDTPTYMPYLQQQFKAHGGHIVQRIVNNLDDLTVQFDLVVNCAGVWAGELVGDTAVTPIRGQIIRVSKPAALPDEIVHVDADIFSTYIVPRRHDCILGGSKHRDNWALTPDPKLAENIWQRCLAIQPALQNAKILEHRVGLRPGRPEVRLEMEVLGGGKAIIHNYGHGSIGHTLAWGCAAEVAALAIEK